jgi:hypothetical protein
MVGFRSTGSLIKAKCQLGTHNVANVREKKQTLSFGFDVLGSCFGATTDEGSAGSALHASGAVFDAAGLALLKKSSLPDGFGFDGSSLTPSLTSFGSDLTRGFVSVVVEEAALDRAGSLFLEVEAAAEGFTFAEDRVGRRSVRFCETIPFCVSTAGRRKRLLYFDVRARDLP